MRDVVEFGEGRAVNDSVERLAWVFLYEEIPDAVHSFPGFITGFVKGA